MRRNLTTRSTFRFSKTSNKLSSTSCRVRQKPALNQTLITRCIRDALLPGPSREDWINPSPNRIVSHKKTPDGFPSGVLNKCLTMTYSHMGSPTLPSAQSRFTTEFEMGSGGTNSLWSSGKLSACRGNSFTMSKLGGPGLDLAL